MMKFILISVAILFGGKVYAEVDHDVKLTQGEVYTKLETPNYPEIYSGEKSITWQFEAEEDSKVQIKCEDFRLSDTEDCEAIKVLIQDGEDQESFCGHYDAFKQISTNNKITVTLQNDQNGQAVFSCFVKSTKGPKPEEVQLVSNETFTLSNPQESVSFFDKVWKLKAEEGNQIHLECYINLLKTEPCHDDVLTIDYGAGPEEFCGYQTQDLLTKDNEVTIRLELDKIGDGRVSCTARSVAIKSVEENNARGYWWDDDEEGNDSSEYGSSPGPKNTTCACGWSNKPKARIIFGNEVSPNEYPWMVSVRVDMGAAYGMCGGSIITNRHIITAAHCLVNMHAGRTPVPADTVTVVVGAHNLAARTPKHTYQTFSAEQLIVRSEFIQYTTHDIAVIVLSGEIKYTREVGPICLSPRSLNEPDLPIRIMGWGKTAWMPTSDTLLAAKVNIVDTRDCGAQRHEVCTTTHSSATCSGDSGGPLVWVDPDTNMYTQVSLVSYGAKDCVSIPSVSTDISYFYDWIQEIIRNTYAEQKTCSKA